MDNLKRDDMVSVVSRHIGTAYSNTVFGTAAPRMKWCSYHNCLEPINNFYVKSERQNIPRENLKDTDFRHVCIEVWDQLTKNQRKGYGWLTDEEVNDKLNSKTLEMFFLEKVDVNE